MEAGFCGLHQIEQVAGIQRTSARLTFDIQIYSRALRQQHHSLINKLLTLMEYVRLDPSLHDKHTGMSLHDVEGDCALLTDSELVLGLKNVHPRALTSSPCFPKYRSVS